MFIQGDQGVSTSSAYALLEHADEEGYVEDLDALSIEPATTAKPVQAAPKAKQPASKARPAATTAATSRNSNYDATAGSSRAAAGHNSAGKSARAEDYYRAFEHVYKDASTGEVVLRFHKTNIVRIKPNGDIILTTGGWYTFTTMSAMNDALLALHMQVSHRGPVTAGVWAVTDDTGHVLAYKDGMVIPASNPSHRNRGAAVLTAYSGGAEVPVYGVKPQSRTASQAANRTGAFTGTMGRVKQTTACAAGNAGSYSAALVPSQSGAAAYTSQHQQQQYYNAAQPSAVPVSAHMARKSVHEQLQEAVEQLGLEDELICGDEHLCVVCLERQRDEVLVPCGHMVLCRMCCSNIRNDSNECPVCREVIVDHCTLDPHHP